MESVDSEAYPDKQERRLSIYIVFGWRHTIWTDKKKQQQPKAIDMGHRFSFTKSRKLFLSSDPSTVPGNADDARQENNLETFPVCLKAAHWHTQSHTPGQTAHLSTCLASIHF